MGHPDRSDATTTATLPGPVAARAFICDQLERDASVRMDLLIASPSAPAGAAQALRELEQEGVIREAGLCAGIQCYTLTSRWNAAA